MALYIEAGWDENVTGSSTLTITESGGGGATNVTVAAATYCHSELTSVLGTSNYNDYADVLKTALDTASPNAVVYTVTWSRTAGTYTISVSSGTVALSWSGDAGTRSRQILGFSGNQSTASSHTSDVVPYYYIDPANDAKSNVSDDYEPDSVVEGAEGDDGTQYAVHRTTAPTYSDFDVTAEAKAAVFKRSATSGTPWTYQHLWEHCRGRQPLLVTDDNDNTVCFLRPEGASFKPTRMVSDWDDRWSLTFLTTVRGRL